MTVKNIQKIMKDKEIDYVDLRFTDPRGKLQHVTMDAKVVDDDMLEEGIFFDGSSIAGWKAINESDMILKPDISLTCSASAKQTSFSANILFTLFNEHFLSPETKHIKNEFFLLKTKLLTIAPTSQSKALDASRAVLAEFSKIWIFKFLSNKFRAVWTLFTGSLFAISLIQLLVDC